MSTIRLQKNPEIYWTELSPENLLCLFQFSLVALVAGHLAKIKGEVKQTKIISQLSLNQLETTKLRGVVKKEITFLVVFY